MKNDRRKIVRILEDSKTILDLGASVGRTVSVLKRNFFLQVRPVQLLIRLVSEYYATTH